MSVDNGSYNKGGFIAFIFSFGFSMLFFIYISFFHPGVDLKEIKEVQETNQDLAGGETSSAPAVDIASVSKPWVEDAAVATYGAGLYRANCAMCHGTTGLGDGPAGKAIGARDLVEGAWVQGGDSISLFKTVTSGVAGTSMAGFKHIPVKDRWALVQFVRSITKSKPADNSSDLEAFASKAD